jgi:hypothetical protein
MEHRHRQACTDPNRNAATKTPGLSAWRRGLVGDLTSSINFAMGRDASVRGFLTDPAQIRNRADVKVLTECIITGTIGSLDASTAALGTPYPVPSTNTMPVQEPLPAAVQRPSGPVAAQGACATTTTGNPNPAVVPTPAFLPSTATGGGGGGPLVAASVAGVVALVAGWWASRVHANRAAGATSDDEEGAD